MILKQGKKNEIRRIFKFSNIKLLSLKRVKFGNIALGHLKEGFWRELTKKEKEYFRTPCTIFPDALWCTKMSRQVFPHPPVIRSTALQAARGNKRREVVAEIRCWTGRQKLEGRIK